MLDGAFGKMSCCCVICLEDLDVVCQCPHCGQVYHKDCLIKWIDCCGRYGTCPTCRGWISEKDCRDRKHSLRKMRKCMWPWSMYMTLIFWTSLLSLVEVNESR